MIKSQVISCDGPGCEQLKRETNHWWVMNLVDWEQKVARICYVMPWATAAAAEIAQAKHACSRECAHKLLEAWMEAV